MKYLDLRGEIATNVFTVADVTKAFSQENAQSIKVQLFRLVKKGLLHSLKRGVYCFDKTRVDELELAQQLYSPSYISLETALHYYGIIPDIPQGVTSVTTITTKKIATELGMYYYTKIKLPLFFGFESVISPLSGGYFSIAKKEKALLDYLYIRKITSIADLRVNREAVDMNIYKKYAQHFPRWVQEIVV